MFQNLGTSWEEGDNEDFVFDPVKFYILSKIIFTLF